MKTEKPLFSPYLKKDKDCLRIGTFVDLALVAVPTLLGVWLIVEGEFLTGLLDRVIAAKGLSVGAAEVYRGVHLNGALLVVAGVTCICFAVALLKAMRRGSLSGRWPPASLRRNLCITDRIHVRGEDGRGLVIMEYAEVVEEVGALGTVRIAATSPSYFLVSGEPVRRDTDGYVLSQTGERLVASMDTRS